MTGTVDISYNFLSSSGRTLLSSSMGWITFFSFSILPAHKEEERVVQVFIDDVWAGSLGHSRIIKVIPGPVIIIKT